MQNIANFQTMRTICAVSMTTNNYRNLLKWFRHTKCAQINGKKMKNRNKDPDLHIFARNGDLKSMKDVIESGNYVH